MKTKGFSYDLENDLMFLKCLGFYNSRLKADSQEVKEYKEPSLLAGIEDAKQQGCF